VKNISKIGNIKDLFNKNQFKHLGFDNESAQETHYKNLADSLFFLELEVKNLLMPYVAKVENFIKVATNESDLNKAINSILSNMSKEEYIEKFCAKIPSVDITKLKKLSKNGNSLKEFILLLNVFRQGRNIVMHGDESLLGQKFSDSKKRLNHFSEKNFFSDEEYIKLFNLSSFNKAIPMSTKKDPSLLYIMFKIISIFNHKKTNYMLLAKIDYKIFVFRNSTNICKEVKLYE
jgi:hypothetical protein